MINNEVLGYDCDGNEIEEFRILRYPFSSGIQNWDTEPKIDPRFYCLIKDSKNQPYAISVYNNYNYKQIRKYENISQNEKIPVIVKPASDMRYYEVAWDYEANKPWFYDRDKNELKRELESNLEQSKHKKLIKTL